MQAVFDLPALLQTLYNNDLNAIRAKMPENPEQSKYTSVRRRLYGRQCGLMKFSQRKTVDPAVELSSMRSLPITFKDYLELLDWTGRQVRKGKRGSIDESAPVIMNRLGFTPEKWIKAITPQVSWKQRALGNAEKISEYCKAIGQRWIWQFS